MQHLARVDLTTVSIQARTNDRPTRAGPQDDDATFSARRPELGPRIQAWAACGRPSLRSRSRCADGAAQTARRPRQATSRGRMRPAEACFARYGYAGTSVAEIVPRISGAQGSSDVYSASKRDLRRAHPHLAHEIHLIRRTAIADAASHVGGELAATAAFFNGCAVIATYIASRTSSTKSIRHLPSSSTRAWPGGTRRAWTAGEVHRVQPRGARVTR